MVAVGADTETVFGQIARARVVPVVKLARPDLGSALARALLEAGLGVIEITFRAAGAAEAIRSIRREVPAMLVGAGTVLTVAQAEEAMDAGASFVVSPGSNPTVIDRVSRGGLPMIPGIATPTEIEANLDRGLNVLKFFPAVALGGVGFLRAVHGPYPDVAFIPTGGVSETNLASFLAEPNVLACGGTWIAPPALLAAGDFDAVVDLARKVAATAADAPRVGGPSGSRG